MLATHRLFAAAIALAVCTTGCGKEKKKSEPAAGPGAAVEPAGAAGSALAYLPADSSQVFGISLPSIRESALFKQFSPMLMEQLSGELGKLKGACGLDPITAIESITAGVVGEGEAAKPFAVVQGIDKATVIKCGQALAEAKTAEGEKVEVKIDGDYAEVVTAEGSQWILFVGDKTVISGKDLTREQLAERASGKNGLNTSKAFLDIYSKVDSNAGVWIVSKAPSGGEMGIDFQSIYGSIALTDGLAVKAGLGTASAADAKAAVDKINEQIGALKSSMFGKYLASFKIEPSGQDVKMSLTLSVAELGELAKMAPMLMGGGGGGADE